MLSLRKIYLVNIFILLFFILDRLIKKFLLLHFKQPNNFFIFELRLYQNKHIAFGLPVNQVFLYILISLILIGLVYELSLGYKKGKIIIILSFTLIIMGALDNLIDRIIYGGVVDYIDFPLFPVFNLADLMITLGAVLILVYQLRQFKKEHKS